MLDPEIVGTVELDRLRSLCSHGNGDMHSALLLDAEEYCYRSSVASSVVAASCLEVGY